MIQRVQHRHIYVRNQRGEAVVLFQYLLYTSRRFISQKTKVITSFYSDIVLLYITT